MPRPLATFLALAAGCLSLAGAVGTPTASAADALTGRLVNATVSSLPGVPNMTVQLREVTTSGPGTIVDSDVTSSTGAFSLDAGVAPDDEYYVRVVPGTFQGGWVGGVPAGVQPTVGHAATYGPGASLGKVRANPAFMRGVVVDSSTGAPVAGVRATARAAEDLSAVEGADTTNSNGVFRISGLTCEDDCYLKINGSSEDYETGFRACDAQIVPTWGEACGAPLGRIGKVHLDHL